MALGWWVRRLRAMSIAEVAERSWRAARRPIERARMRAGRYAELPHELASWRGPARFYVAPELAASVPASADELVAADAICHGRREVLGLGWLDLPDEPWHVEPVAGDPRTTWEFNRGHEWVVLARVAAATGEARYAARLVAELASWRRANPLGVGGNWASAMEAAIRIHSLAWVAGLRGGDPALAAMIFEHAAFVAAHLSRFSSANNHLIVELTGLIVADRVLGLDRWRSRALAELATELDRQVFADGVNAEMATHYHELVLEALLLVAWLERAHATPQRWLEAVIARMAAYLEALRCADGSLLQQGDSDDGKLLPWFATDHAGQLIAAAAALVAPGERVAAPPPGRDGVFWLTGGRGAPAAAPLPRSRAFLPSGQIVLRSPRVVATFDAGPFGFGALAAHAHCDALAVNVALDGRRVLVDRGTYRYNGDRAARARYRMTAAHNTLQVGTREQAEPGGPFLWTRRPTVTLERCELGGDTEIVVASHDGFAPIIHRRTLLRGGDGILVIVDDISRLAPVAIRFHLAPGLVAARGTMRGLTILGPGPIGWLWCDTDAVSHEVTKHSDHYLAESDATVIVRRAPAGVDTRSITVIGAADLEPEAAVAAGLALIVERGGAHAE